MYVLNVIEMGSIFQFTHNGTTYASFPSTIVDQNDTIASWEKMEDPGAVSMDTPLTGELIGIIVFQASALVCGIIYLLYWQKMYIPN